MNSIFRILVYPFNMLARTIEGIGEYSILMARIINININNKFFLSHLSDQIFNIGVASIPIVIFTSFFTGMVTAVQAIYQYETTNLPSYYIGSVVGETILLELGPMVTCLIMTGKVGATIAAEIGTMRVSEQIDALESLSYDPVQFLISPRVIASGIMFPVLIILADIFGILGGIYACMNSIDISPDTFLLGLRGWFRPWDAWFGVIKGFSFGIAITSISCYKGYYTSGGAEGVGKSTTMAVIASCVAIIVIDWTLAEILL